MAPNQYTFQMAIHDFQSARQKAAVQEVLARITGKSTQLLSYEEVAEKLRLQGRTERGVQHIPVEAIGECRPLYGLHPYFSASKPPEPAALGGRQGRDGRWRRSAADRSL